MVLKVASELSLFKTGVKLTVAFLWKYLAGIFPSIFTATLPPCTCKIGGVTVYKTVSYLLVICVSPHPLIKAPRNRIKIAFEIPDRFMLF